MGHPRFFVLDALCESLPYPVFSNRDRAVPPGGKGSWKGFGTRFILSTSASKCKKESGKHRLGEWAEARSAS